MAKRYTAYLVPHTHWDRAWYLPFEEFRVRLVHLIDELIDLLESNPDFTTFCLDGQSIILEDYLEIRPHMADRLRKLIKRKRLWVGPWYVLPDEYLVSGESMIRNLLLGTRLAESFGRSMNVGYVPDTFGHIAQLPQLLRGFGLDTFIFARGLLPAENDLKVEFNWVAPDGSDVLALHQRFHYNNAVFLGYRIGWGDTRDLVQDKRLALRQIADACAALEPHTHSHQLLLNNGVDHSAPQADLPELVEHAQSAYPQYRFRIASFEDYAKAVKRELKDTPLQRKQGELYFDYGDILHGVYSARMYLKQANRYCQDLLERSLEPLGIISDSLGIAPYPKDFIAYGWRTLLKNHPHDDICGCSVDQVHEDMEHRFAQVRTMGKALETDLLRGLARSINHRGHVGVPVMVYNPTASPRTGVIELHVDLSVHDEPWASFQLVDETGHELAFETVAEDDLFWMEPVKGFQVRRHRIQLPLDVPSLGYRTLYVSQGTPRKPKTELKATAKGCQNEFYSMSIAKDGSLIVTDKATKKRFRGLLAFEDVEDCGDAYNWSYLPEHSHTLTTRGSEAAVSLTRSGPFSATWTITHRLDIPTGLTPDRTARRPETTPLEITSEVTCWARSRRIDVTTRVENTARDHRLRVLFPSNLTTNTVDVDGHFAFLERNVEMPPARELPPYPTQHQGRFVSLRAEGLGVAVINDGMPEFEIVAEAKRRTIALTLFRAVGWLSRDDYATRKVHAGPPLEAPGAQCLRPMEFRYGFMIYDGEPHAAMAEALRHNLPCAAMRGDILRGTDARSLGIPYEPYVLEQPVEVLPRGGDLPPAGTLLSLGSERLQFSALKKCEERDTIIVRVYNPDMFEESGELSLWKPIAQAWSTDLKETRGEALKPKSGVLTFTCPPYAIRTFEIVLD